MRAQIRLVQNVLKHVGFADGRSVLRCFNWIRSHQDLRPRSWRILLVREWLQNRKRGGCCGLSTQGDRMIKEIDSVYF